MGKRLTKMIYLGIKEYRDPYYQGVAAQIAFFFMLSAVPTMLVLSQILGLLDISLNFIENWVKQNVSVNMAHSVGYLFTAKAKFSSNVLFIIMAVWAASRVHFSLGRVADYTYSEGQKLNNYFKDRIRALVIMFLTIVVIALTFVVFVYGEIVARTLFENFFDIKAIETTVKLLKLPLAGFLYFFVILFNYYILPSERMTFRKIIPGTLFAAIGMLVVTVVYSMYANYVTSYDILYGSLASIAALMFWFYFISWVLCLGILVNKVWMQTSEM